MDKGISLALVIVGIILMAWGVNASESLSSGVSRFFTGSPTNKAMWLVIGGIAAVLIGLANLIRGGKG
jgi:hypothetical protein